MKKPMIVLVAMLLAACAAQEETVTKDEAQAVRDFIAVRDLGDVDKLRSTNDDHWYELDASFIIYETRREVFLVEFSRACHELSQQQVVADRRWDKNTVWARFDTIRGCRIGKIFPLTVAEVEELMALSESPGSRN